MPGICPNCGKESSGYKYSPPKGYLHYPCGCPVTLNNPLTMKERAIAEDMYPKDIDKEESEPVMITKERVAEIEGVHPDTLKEVDWDILYIDNKYSQTQEVKEYLEKEYQYSKAVTKDEWKAIRNDILPYERFEDNKLADMGVKNLVPLLFTIEGKGLYRTKESEPLSTTDSK